MRRFVLSAARGRKCRRRRREPDLRRTWAEAASVPESVPESEPEMQLELELGPEEVARRYRLRSKLHYR